MGLCLSTSGEFEGVGCGRGVRAKRKQRKQEVMEFLAAEAKKDELLSHLPGRICRNGASSSACIFTQQGRKGTNQDAMVVWENFTSRDDTTFGGVFDGHGPFGHLVARKVRDSLPSKLTAHWKSLGRGEKTMASRIAENEGAEAESVAVAETALDVDQSTVFTTWKKSFLKAFNVMDKELRSHPTIDCFCSGTTAVTMLLQGQDLVIANLGDSRAVLGTLTENNTLEAVQLTIDLKPNLPLEAERIRRCRGRVFALEDEPEVARVWLPFDDSPGLAMARAFGDICLKDFGLIAVPEVTYRKVTERDQFVVLASDGVWDVLSNKEVVEVIRTAPTRTTAARALVETAVRSWRLKYPTSKIDDCAVVCVYLDKTHRQTPTPPVAGVDAAPRRTSAAIAPDILPLASPTSPHTLSSPSPAPSTDSDADTYPPSPITATPEIVTLSRDDDIDNKVVERSASRRSLAECLSIADDEEEEWSALEGITRVNSLLNLPRFLVGDRRVSFKRSTTGIVSRRKH